MAHSENDHRAHPDPGRHARGAAKATTAARLRVLALISPSGHGNLGDEAIVAATIEYLRLRLPEARFVGITLHPDDTRRRFGIEAFPIAGVSRPGYLVRGDLTAEALRVEAQFARDADRSHPSSPPTARGPSDRALTSVLKRAVKRVVPRDVLWIAVQELRHLRAARRLVQGVDLVVVAGGGQIDDMWGGTWGHPYALFKWASLARQAGRPLVVASVGFGTLRAPLSRWFARRALRVARYRSFRDEGSLRRMQQAGLAHEDPVLPDLAFGLDRRNLIARAQQSRVPGLVCVGPMVFLDPATWPIKDQAGHEAYLDRLASLAVGLVEAGRKVALISSDGPDRRTVAAVYDRISARVSPADLGRVSVPQTDSVDRFLVAVAGADVFVGSRLHGLLLSLLAGTPVLALAYDRKVDALMHAMDLGADCLGIGDFDPADAVARTLRLAADGDGKRAAIAARVREFSGRVQTQFDQLLT